MLGFNVKCTITELENKIIGGDFDKEIFDYLVEILTDFNDSPCCNDAINLLEGKSNPYDLFDFTIETDDGYLFFMPYEDKYVKKYENLKTIFRCKALLIFEKVVIAYNEYKSLNETEFYGAESDSSDKDRIMGNAEFCMEEHKKAFENWSEGNIVDCWEDEDSNTCVRYDSGNWWHYKIVSYGDDNLVSEWW